MEIINEKKYSIEDLRKAVDNNRQKQLTSSNKDPNDKCIEVIDFLFENILSTMNSDKGLNGIQKAIVIGATKKITPDIKNYIKNNMSKEDSIRVLNGIMTIITK